MRVWLPSLVAVVLPHAAVRALCLIVPARHSGRHQSALQAASIARDSTKTLCSLFSVLIVSTLWPGIAGLPLTLILIVMVLQRSKCLIYLWPAGVPMVFVYGNNFLGAISLLCVERAFLPLFVLGLRSSRRASRALIKPLLDVEKIMRAVLLIAGIFNGVVVAP